MLNNGSGSSLREHQEACLVLLNEFDRVCKELNITYVLFAGTLLGAVRHQGFIPWDDDLDVLMSRKDYEIFISNADKFLDNKFFLQREFSDHWPMFFSKLRLNGTTCMEKYHAKDKKEHHGIYIDIFPYDNAANTKFARKMQFLASKIVIAKSLDKRGYETDSFLKKLFIIVCKLLPKRVFIKIAKSNNYDSKYVHTFFAASSDFEKNVFLQKHFEEKELMAFEGKEYLVPKLYDEILIKLYGNYMVLPSEEERSIKKHAIFVDTKNSYESYLDFYKEFKIDNYTKSIR
jgi:lipopolysaccharide cholinephosphotransferase